MLVTSSLQCLLVCIICSLVVCIIMNMYDSQGMQLSGKLSGNAN